MPSRVCRLARSANGAAFSEVIEAIAMVAPVDGAVLLLGETGTGKKVIARAIHEAGPRRHQRFVAVNCAAIPGGAARKRTVRSRTRRIRRRGVAGGRTISGRRPGHVVSGRSRRPPAGTAAQIAPSPAGQQIERLGSGGRATSVDVRVVDGVDAIVFTHGSDGGDKARSNLGCSSRRRSPTSSRNNVPRSAA